jgi:hypothetical protein
VNIPWRVSGNYCRFPYWLERPPRVCALALFASLGCSEPKRDPLADRGPSVENCNDYTHEEALYDYYLEYYLYERMCETPSTLQEAHQNAKEGAEEILRDCPDGPSSNYYLPCEAFECVNTLLSWNEQLEVDGATPEACEEMAWEPTSCNVFRSLENFCLGDVWEYDRQSN